MKSGYAIRSGREAAKEIGITKEEVATEYNVTLRSVNRYLKLFNEKRSVTEKPKGGDRRSYVFEAYHEDIIEVLDEKPDRTLKDMATNLIAKLGQTAKFGVSMLWQFFIVMTTLGRKNRTRFGTEKS